MRVYEDLKAKPKKEKPNDITDCLSVLKSTRALQTTIGLAVLAVLLFAAKVENGDRNAKSEGADSPDVAGVTEMEGATGDDMEGMTEDEIADHTFRALAQVLNIDTEVLMEDGTVDESVLQKKAGLDNNPDLATFIVNSV